EEGAEAMLAVAHAGAQLDMPRGKIFARVAGEAEEGVVAGADATGAVDEANSEDVGLPGGAELPVAVFAVATGALLGGERVAHTAVEAGVFEGEGGDAADLERQLQAVG